MTTITAHSGADGFPDNSLAFVRHALASAADALEVDVRRDAGGALRLGHDAADAALPSLAEVFALLRDAPGKRVNCDLKEPELEAPVCSLARDFDLAGRVILTGTADPARWAASPLLRKTAELWLNLEAVVPEIYTRAAEPGFLPAAAERIAAVCLRCSVATVNFHYRLAVPAFTERMAAAGLGLSVWTVNEPDDIRRFLAENVRSLTTRNLTEAIRLKSAGERK